MRPEDHLTPKKMDEIRDEIESGEINSGYHATVTFDAFEVIEDLRRRNKKLERLYKALKEVVDDDSYEAGYIAHPDCCNTHHAWGPKEAECDCYVADVHKALAALDGSVLDDLVGD